MYGWTDQKSLLQEALEVLLQAELITSFQVVCKSKTLHYRVLVISVI